MCPACWASLLATISILGAPSTILVAAKDRWTVLGAAGLFMIGLAYRCGWMTTPWWVSAALASVVLLRLCWLAYQRAMKLMANRERFVILPCIDACGCYSSGQAGLVQESSGPVVSGF